LALQGEEVKMGERNGGKKVVTLRSCCKKGKNTYLEPVMDVPIVSFYCSDVYSLAIHCPVRFPCFPVTYVSCDVLLTPSFELVAFFYMSPNAIMNH
jgi:hypothetical protein